MVAHVNTATMEDNGGRSPSRAPIRVLMSYPAGPPQGNPYRVILDNSLIDAGEVTIKYFNWRTVILSGYDVFHVHWPETLLHGRTRWRLLARQLLFVILLLRLRLTRTPIVRTQHNTELPQGLDRASASLIRAIDRQTTIWIRLNDHTVTPDPSRTVDSTHGHYRDWFTGAGTIDPVPGRVLFFGLVRRYKGVDRLVDVFRSLPRMDATLHVVGKPTSDDTREMLVDKAERDTRITLRLENVDDAALVQEVGAAKLVALPYTEMHNSAAVITALSLNRPVLVPDNPVTASLAAEVGSAWVRTYHGSLDAEDIARALDDVENLEAGPPPDLSKREWSRVAATHIVAYQRAVSVCR